MIERGRLPNVNLPINPIIVRQRRATLSPIRAPWFVLLPGWLPTRDGQRQLLSSGRVYIYSMPQAQAQIRRMKSVADLQMVAEPVSALHIDLWVLWPVGASLDGLRRYVQTSGEILTVPSETRARAVARESNALVWSLQEVLDARVTE